MGVGSYLLAGIGIGEPLKASESSFRAPTSYVHPIVRHNNQRQNIQQGNYSASSVLQVAQAQAQSERENYEKEVRYGDWRRPVSSADADPFHFSSIAYPRHITNEMANGHYMLFYVNVQNKTKYGYDAYDDKGNSIRIGDKVIENKSGGRGNFDVVGAEDPNYVSRLNNIGAGGKGNLIQSDGVDLRKGGRSGMGKGTGMNSWKPTTSRITDSIAIYLPPNVQTTLGAQYEGVAQGALGLAAAGGGKFAELMRRNDYSAAAKMLTGSAGEIIAAGLQKAIAGAADLFFDTTNSSDLWNKAWGNATNPFMEVFFGGIDLRTFTYNFTFSPRNEDETLDVQKIIQIFRFHMAPELQGENMRYLTLPSTFDIHYMYQLSPDVATENNFYHKIATCVLTNCVVDYTPEAVKSFQSGAPTQITMSLSFTETELMTKERIDEGY